MWYIQRKAGTVLMHSGDKNKEYLESVMLKDNVSLKEFRQAVADYEKLFGLRSLMKFVEEHNLQDYIYNDNFYDSHLPSSARLGQRLGDAQRIGGREAVKRKLYRNT